MRRLIAAIACAPLALACALVREQGPIANPNPHDYPCGAQGTECHDTNPPTCCGARQACATDDSGPYCAADEGWDGSDPVTWGRKVRQPRTMPR